MSKDAVNVEVRSTRPKNVASRVTSVVKKSIALVRKSAQVRTSFLFASLLLIYYSECLNTELVWYSDTSLQFYFQAY